MHVTRDDGKTWTERHAEHPGPARLGHGRLHRAVAVRRGTAYVVVDAHRLDDFQPVPVEDDRRRQDVGEPDGRICRRRTYLHVVREDPKKKGLLYVGTRARRLALDRRREDVAAI